MSLLTNGESFTEFEEGEPGRMRTHQEWLAGVNGSVESSVIGVKDGIHGLCVCVCECVWVFFKK